MRRILAFMLALLMLCCVQPVLAEETGPQLTWVELPGLPQSTYTSLGNGRVLMVNTRETVYANYNVHAIYDLYTGQLTPLYTLESDTEAWIQWIADHNSDEEVTVTPQEVMDWYVQEGQPEMTDFVAQYAGLYVAMPGSHYVPVAGGAVLDVNTGLLRPMTYGSVPFCVGENRISCTIGDGVIELSLYAPDDSLLRTASITADFAFANMLYTSDGLLFVLHSDTIDDKARELSLLFVDGDLAAHPVQLGLWSNNALTLQMAHYSASTGKLLLLTDGTCLGKNTKTRNSETGQWQFTREPYGPYLDDLLVVDTATGAVQTVALADEYLVPLGMSADGSHALLGGMEALYWLDMETLALTKGMSDAEVRALYPLPQQPGEFRSLFYFNTSPWDGGDYLVYPHGIFRLTETP